MRPVLVARRRRHLRHPRRPAHHRGRCRPSDIHAIGMEEVTEKLPAEYAEVGGAAVRDRRPGRRARPPAHRPVAPLRRRRGDHGRRRRGAGLGHGRSWATGSAGCPSHRAPSSRCPSSWPPTPRRLLLPSRRRRVPARHLLRQHPPAGQQGPLRDGVHRLPRGHPGPPPAAGHRHRADRRAPLPALLAVQHRLRRGLGPVRRAPGRGDGAVPPRPRPHRHAGRRLDPGLPAGRRHRPARPGLEPVGRRSSSWPPTPRCRSRR